MKFLEPIFSEIAELASFLVMAPVSAASVAVADLNRDGKLDLVVANRNASTVNVLQGNGDGTFRAPIPFGAGKNRYAVALADLNGDGKTDAITTNVSQDAVTVQLGNGDGTFQPGQTVAVGPAPTAVSVADLNGDGRPDIAAIGTPGPGCTLPPAR